MSLPEITTRDRWLAERKALLAEEKALTRARDALNARRRRLPMVAVETPYVFHGPEGELSLLDLFAGRLQLIVSHFMFDPAWEEGCSSCTAGVDEVAPGLLAHLAVRDTRLVYVSRAPLEKLERYKAARGWEIDWYSSYGSDFNYDFHVTLDSAKRPVEYNYRTPEEHEAAGTAYYLSGGEPSEQPGTSVFLRDGDRVFHTYSTYGRGAEQLGDSYKLLDITPLGRQEEWEEPKGRAAFARAARPDFAS
jgi:predicted dithiol-disulfide oxidoreductase (DUF899 family)